ncbi:hypothetical protein ACWDRR_41415 [Kitasatospora sp. NPDC003701]
MDNVQLYAQRRCGERFEPVPSLRIPEVAQVYRFTPGWGEPVPCSEEERARWEAAASTYLAALSRAVEELYRGHGGREAHLRVDLERGTGAWRTLTPVRRWPGWRRRAVERSESAQRAFVAEAERAGEAYRPTREEIDRRLAEQRAAREAALLARRREAESRRAVLDAVAARRVWRYGAEAGGSPVRIDRADRRPASGDPTGGAPEGQELLTAVELEDALRALPGAQDGTTELWWDEPSCAAVEEECRAQGVPVGFAQWWGEVARYVWTAGPHGPKPVPPSPPRRDFGYPGAGSGYLGSGGYSGGHSCGFGGY